MCKGGCQPIRLTGGLPSYIMTLRYNPSVCPSGSHLPHQREALAWCVTVRQIGIYLTVLFYYLSVFALYFLIALFLLFPIRLNKQPKQKETTYSKSNKARTENQRRLPIDRFVIIVCYNSFSINIHFLGEERPKWFVLVPLNGYCFTFCQQFLQLSSLIIARDVVFFTIRCTNVVVACAFGTTVEMLEDGDSYFFCLQ